MMTNPIIIAIDGRCGAGKTTLANLLSAKLDCNIIHTDDFFLRPEQRTDTRLATPGENIDHERFLEEVLIPLSKGLPVSFRPFNCHSMTLGNIIKLAPKHINIIEGTYSCHLALRRYYDYMVFLTVSKNEQLQRIINREGRERAKIFEEKWIPLEEAYFKTVEGIQWRCLKDF